MTTTRLLTSIALAATIAGGAAVAQAGQAQVRAAQDTWRADAQRQRADRGDDTRCDRDEYRRDRGQRAHHGRAYRTKPVLLPVANISLPDQAAYGWQYFSARRAMHAVVISPAGEYFLSLGDGPRQITGPAGQVLGTQPAEG